MTTREAARDVMMDRVAAIQRKACLVSASRIAESVFVSAVRVEKMKGIDLPRWTIHRCQELLRQTDLNLRTIAMRLGVSKSAVATINHTYKIRQYVGKTHFRIDGELHEAT